ncbi:helix-turn-helix transcriptional regulator [Streptomyces sp. WZ-12]|uniref:helix-turn-helix transcriptional regulator n=1 Tax=Streptomyces sp. WZ-12 TaxID=3030210 RepID=UPI00238132D5|nr:LuxR family transcriptional regulator [Streptomyces sp. WZ-12]
MTRNQPGSPSLLTTLVGRDEELRTLARHAEAARAGRAGLILLHGPAGMGKTSLLRAFTAGGACRGMTVLHGTCGETVAGAGYGGVRELLGGLGLSDDAARHSPLLTGLAARALPALTDDPAGHDAATAAYPVLHGLYWLAARLMTERPLVLVLDDVHWCDERSLAWIDFLLRRAEDLPLLVVLALRSEAEPVAPAVLADLTAQRRPTVLGLDPLGPDAVRELVRRFFPGPAAASFVERVGAVSGGNPLTLARLLDELRTEGVVPDDAGERRAAEVGGHVLARSVRSLLAGRPPWVRDVARALAVLGEECTELLAALAGVPAATADEALLVLRRAGILATDRIDFVHDVVRSAVLDDIAPPALAELRTGAALLLSDAGRPSEELAGQLMLLPELDQPWMAGVLRDAAAQAESRGAPEAGVRCLYRVLEVEPDNVAVRIHMARALAEINPPEAIRLLKEARALGTDVRTRAQVAVQYGFTCLAVQESPSGARMLAEALDELEAALGPEPGPADRELRTLVESALLIVGADEKATIGTVRERAARLTAPPGDTPAERQLLTMATVLTAMDGRDARATADQARRALRAPGVEREPWSLLPASFALALADEITDAQYALDLMLQYGQDNAAVWTYVLALSTRALLHHDVGAFPDALADAQTAMEIIGEERWGDSAVLPRVALATALVDRGEPERAERVLDGITRDRLERFVIEYHWYLMARAHARWARGDLHGALTVFLTCGRSLEETRVSNAAFVPWWAEAAVLSAVLDRHGQARELAAFGLESAERWGTTSSLGLARMAHGVARPDGAGIEHLTEAVALLADSPARGMEARAELLLGNAHLQADDQRAAREHLRAAADLAQRCGAVSLGDTARKLLVSAGGRVRRMATSPLDMLTGMERTVADLARTGVSNRDIAETLFVTVRTIETHLTSVYRKLGVAGRTELSAVLETRITFGPQSPAWVSQARGRG